MAGPNTKDRAVITKPFQRIREDCMVIPIKDYQQIIRTSNYREKSKKRFSEINSVLRKRLNRCRGRNRIAVVREQLEGSRQKVRNLQAQNQYYKRRVSRKIKEVDRLIEQITNQLENEQLHSG